jgi:acyl carrier protein
MAIGSRKIVSITTKVKEMVAYQLGIKESNVTLNADLVEDLGADSLDLIELLMDVEYQFETEIEDDVAEKFRTVQDIINYLEVESK